MNGINRDLEDGGGQVRQLVLLILIDLNTGVRKRKRASERENGIKTWSRTTRRRIRHEDELLRFLALVTEIRKVTKVIGNLSTFLKLPYRANAGEERRGNLLLPLLLGKRKIRGAYSQGALITTGV